MARSEAERSSRPLCSFTSAAPPLALQCRNEGYYPTDAYRWPPGPELPTSFTPVFHKHNAVTVKGNSIWMSCLWVNCGLWGSVWTKDLKLSSCATLESVNAKRDGWDASHFLVKTKTDSQHFNFPRHLNHGNAWSAVRVAVTVNHWFHCFSKTSTQQRQWAGGWGGGGGVGKPDLVPLRGGAVCLRWLARTSTLAVFLFRRSWGTSSDDGHWGGGWAIQQAPLFVT